MTTEYAELLAETERSYDRGAAEFAQRTWALPLDAMRSAFLAAVLERSPRRAVRLLDAGCGPGRDIAWFLARGCRVVGADRSRGMLAEARQRVPAAPVVRMDLREPPFAPHRFDGVWMCASLLHVPKRDWLPTLQRYRQLLDGGLLFLSVKHGEGERLMPAPRRADGERFFSYVTEDELGALLSAAGFRVRHQSRGPGEPEHDWLQVHAEPAD